MELVAVVVDAREPEALARFWSRALGWDVGEVDGMGVDLLPTDVTRFGLRFQRSTEPKAGPNPTHFDLTTTSPDDQDRTVAELLSIGARHLDIGQGLDATHVVLADPEGNELCVIEPYNRFLASCPRLGAVNADGTRALGCFYRDALGWPLVWDEHEETAVQAPTGTGPKLTWSGPPLLPKSTRERIHFHVAPTAGTPLDVAVDELLALGATHLVAGHACARATRLADVDGNELCLVPSDDA